MSVTIICVRQWLLNSQRLIMYSDFAIAFIETLLVFGWIVVLLTAFVLCFFFSRRSFFFFFVLVFFARIRAVVPAFLFIALLPFHLCFASSFFFLFFLVFRRRRRCRRRWFFPTLFLIVLVLAHSFVDSFHGDLQIHRRSRCTDQ